MFKNNVKKIIFTCIWLKMFKVRTKTSSDIVTSCNSISLKFNTCKVEEMIEFDVLVTQNIRIWCISILILFCYVAIKLIKIKY